MSVFAEISADLAAFADDDEELVIDPNGQCLFIRGGKETLLRIFQSGEQLLVEVDEESIPYSRFLTHNLAQLPVLAERILSKREPVRPYVDSSALLKSPSETEHSGTALQLLGEQTETSPVFLSRVVFITADAGQGKTALLREFQHTQARAFLNGKSDFLFWHVDLQGRQLLRLSEALMGDLGDLRMSGLWMPAVVRLLRRGKLMLAIDGFDELAAEQGGTDALGALSLMVHQLEGQGTIVAASRRTFFDTDDYIRRAGMFKTTASDCEFNEIRLEEWDSGHALTYLRAVKQDGRSFSNPKETYEEISSELGSDDHPILTRPFLLAQVSRGLLRYDLAPTDFIRGMEDPLQAVGTVIEAFVEREVNEKWKQQETGEPFLTKDQHLRLLADVAEEMYRTQRSTITVDVLETVTAILLDELSIEPARRQQVIEMVKMHVLLTPPSDGAFSERSFDHDEFRDWFTAYAFKDRLLQLGDAKATMSQDILGLAHLPDATAKYVCSLFERTPKLVASIAQGLAELARNELRPTYLQTNTGTMLPFLLDRVVLAERLTIEAEVVFSSLVHEGKQLRDVTFRGAVFSNASLVDAHWKDVALVECNLGELVINDGAHFEGVKFVDCELDGIRLLTEEAGDEVREYEPGRIAKLLDSRGITVESSSKSRGANIELSDGELRKLVRRLLNTFRRTTFVVDETLQQRFRGDTKQVREEVIPFMEKMGVLEQRPWRGSGRHHAWGLVGRLEDVEKADGDPSNALHAFWDAIDRADATGGKLD
jgi:hypothetical protein